ncbi:chemotaxis protein [Psychrobacter sp. P2G3]|nr:chemotaxis protein [Psychrobacter sp. P2G3]
MAAELAALNSPAIESRENARALGELATNTQARLAGIDRDILTRTGVMWPAIIFLLGLLGVIYTLSQLLKQHGGTERILIEKETLRRRQEAETESERARQIQEENERNQMAILRLLDELGDLAEGDLTVNATVSEDFTGAIADSVNFAIDQLRQLVLVINSTAERVSQSSGQTQMNAVELAEASEHQAQEIASVSAAINEMAISIDQVSTNATESASVAQRSVAIAYNGADVVQRSIEGMNVIRDQIQETSKRIKRLGESSQEIGDIVSLINDIADQTNVLALNAAIQASMAGDAGRGFAVVADEVQRLAERSANATKQIETLVKTIQADTSEAVMSMETTTSEVVRGARLAKDAGEALEEVQSVSNTLADLIQNISNAAQQQAESAGHISNAMNIIQDITSQTSSGTMATARSVGELSEMAAALQESVTGFKISNDDKQVHDYEEDFQDHTSAMA